MIVQVHTNSAARSQPTLHRFSLQEGITPRLLCQHVTGGKVILCSIYVLTQAAARKPLETVSAAFTQRVLYLHYTVGTE